MANKKDLKIGQTVWICTLDGRNVLGVRKDINEVQITEIGNKYFKTSYGGGYKFEIDTLMLFSHYTSDKKVILDKELFLKELEIKEHFLLIKSKLNEISAFNKNFKESISPEKIEQIYNILFG